MTWARQAVAVFLLLILAACSAAPAATPTPEPTPEPTQASTDVPTQAPPTDAPTVTPTDAEIGPPETAELTVGFRFPNGTFYLPHLIGMELGYFEEEGLTISDLTTAADLGAALQGGSVDIAMEWPEAPYHANQADLPMTIISGYICRTRQAFAVQPDVESVEDLDGQAVTLAGVSGDLQAESRKNVLALNGWDLDTVNVEFVYPGGGSDVWRQFFTNGQIALMPYFVDDVVPLREYGANFILDTLVYAPRGVLVATPQFVEQNPNTVARYLRALMRSHQYLLEPGIGQDPAHREEMIAMLTEAEFTDPVPEGPWGLAQNDMCPNLHVADEGWDRLMDLYELEPVPLEEVSMLEPLYRAQESLGLDNSPPEVLDWPPEN